MNASFFQLCSQLAWHPPCRHFMELQNILDEMVCWSMTHTQMCGYFIHCYAAIFLHDGFLCCNGLWCHYSLCLTKSRRVCYRTNVVHVLLVHSYNCCTDRHASPFWTFICRWMSMGFTPSLLSKRLTERCSSLVYVASGAAIFTLLLRRRVAFLHRTATCRPLFNPWVSLLSTCKIFELCFEFLSHF